MKYVTRLGKKLKYEFHIANEHNVPLCQSTNAKPENWGLITPPSTPQIGKELCPICYQDSLSFKQKCVNTQIKYDALRKIKSFIKAVS
jgi:hypothetical protein